LYERHQIKIKKKEDHDGLKKKVANIIKKYYNIIKKNRVKIEWYSIK